MAVQVLVLVVCVLQASGLQHPLALRHTEVSSPELDVQEKSTGCSEGWRRFESSCYGIGDSPDTWSGALEVCTKYGATLAEVESSGENEFLKEIAMSRGYSPGLWLGGTDMFNEGHFEWAGSRKLIRSGAGFTDWGSGQPDDFNRNEDCLHLWSAAGYRWNDASCTTHLNFACERKL